VLAMELAMDFLNTAWASEEKSLASMPSRLVLALTTTAV